MGSCLCKEKNDEAAAEQEARDLDARAKAAEAAERRQQEYAQSAHGRATAASIEKAQKERERDANRGGSDAPLMRWQVG